MTILYKQVYLIKQLQDIFNKHFIPIQVRLEKYFVKSSIIKLVFVLKFDYYYNIWNLDNIIYCWKYISYLFLLILLLLYGQHKTIFYYKTFFHRKNHKYRQNKSIYERLILLNLLMISIYIIFSVYKYIRVPLKSSYFYLMNTKNK